MLFAGTDNGVLLGFGMHLNVECRSTDVADVLPVLRAFALLEDWLRGSDPIDLSRRVLPFVDPYPRAFVTELAEARDWDFAKMAQRYRALDLLPILALVNEETVRRMLGDEKIGARPAFHYRLPDCRIDEPDWSIAHEWDKWALVEDVAEDPDALAHLAKAWCDYKDRWTTTRGDWRASVDDYLVSHGFWRWEGAT